MVPHASPSKPFMNLGDDKDNNVKPNRWVYFTDTTPTVRGHEGVTSVFLRARVPRACRGHHETPSIVATRPLGGQFLEVLC
jgi:hypothetical protein